METCANQWLTRPESSKPDETNINSLTYSRSGASPAPFRGAGRRHLGLRCAVFWELLLFSSRFGCQKALRGQGNFTPTGMAQAKT